MQASNSIKEQIKAAGEFVWLGIKGLVGEGKQQITTQGAFRLFKLLVTLYGYYWAVKLVLQGFGGIYRLIFAKIAQRQIKKRQVSDIFGDCRGDWAVITGASSGIGLEFARILNLCNMNVLLIARDEQKLKQIKDSLSSDLRLAKCAYAVVDFDKASPEDTYSIIDKACQDHSIHEIRLLVNNVGYAKMSPFQDKPLEEAIKEMNCNFRSHFILTTMF